MKKATFASPLELMQEKELRNINPTIHYHPLPPSTYLDATKYFVQKDFCFS
jgi:hypothetical protein